MNSAVALGKLGGDTHFLGRLSTDAFGTQLRSHIEAAQVKLDLASESSQATSIAVVSLDSEGIASYTFHFNGTANFGWQADDLPPLGSSDWLHIASLACVVSPGAEVLLDWMGTLSCGVSYDINIRPTVIADPDEYWAKVKPWLRAVGRLGGIIKASDEDVKFLGTAQEVGGSNEQDPVEIARWLGGDLRLRACRHHPRARRRCRRLAERGADPRTGLPDHCGRHRGSRGHLHGRILGRTCGSWPRCRIVIATGCGCGVDCLLAARGPTADPGRSR